MHQDQQKPTGNPSAGPLSADKTDPTNRQQSRRALLRAAAVAPVIYTLPSGAAVTNTSTCVYKEEDNFRTLTQDELDGVAAGTITEGTPLEGGFEYRPNEIFAGDAIKASCWTSLSAA